MRFLLFALTLATALAQSPNPKTEASVKVFEEDWLHALLTHDRAKLETILADSFADTTWKGEVHTKQQLLNGLTTRSPYDQKLADVTVAFYGDTAIVRGTNLISDKGSVVARIRFTDVLVLNHNHWQAISAQETPAK
jgi:hypothetical protein